MTSRRFRFAPSPTRLLHVGNALAALIGWAEARRSGGSFLLRIEDIDAARCKPEYEEACLRDLTWLGIDWDEGPDVGGEYGPYRQSERLHLYDAALSALQEKGQAYLCVCSRAAVRAAQSAPHARPSGELPYPGTCQYAGHSVDDTQVRPGGYRFALESVGEHASVTWDDGWQGRQSEDVRATCGDFLLGRPSAPSYQLAVCVDDEAMAISDVVRGRDLLHSTGRQIVLHQALGNTAPRFAHHPLLLDESDRKLSKRDDALSLSALREAGVAPQRLIAHLAQTIGLVTNATSTLSAKAFADRLAALPSFEDTRWTELP